MIGKGCHWTENSVGEIRHKNRETASHGTEKEGIAINSKVVMIDIRFVANDLPSDPSLS
jgi:hypothetical protein